MVDITIDFKTLQDSENIAEELDEEQLRHVGRKVVEWYEKDKESRSEWEERSQDALDLALQIRENKTFPWPNASNVKFPLLTIAALQFSARVYPALITAPDLVKYRVTGKDPDGQKAARATRVSRFMSYQLLEENEEWEEEQDKLFITLPILGCVFKKSYYDYLDDQVKSRLVLPQDLVLHYWTKDLSRSRATEVFELYVREIRERQLKGLYVDRDITDFKQGSPEQGGRDTDERQGLRMPVQDEETPRKFLECHCFFDFDGDGYAEPYVITVDKESGLTLRILNRFGKVTSEQSLEIERIQNQNQQLMRTIPRPEQVQQLPEEQRIKIMGRIRSVQAQIEANQTRIHELGAQQPDVIKIDPVVYYTKYSFIPAPDGGYYDLGFGQLLGPLNESVNTVINQLIDSGTMQNGNQGFIGKGARIKGSSLRFEPYEWKRVEVGGSTLKDNIIPLPINEPSNVLFELLGLLINYSERVSSVSDIMQGENPGQNTAAFNMQSMLEQGMQVFNGVFKRIYRSFRSELRKIYDFNSKFLDVERYVSTLDGEFQVLRTDFGGDPKDITPAADPNAFSNMEKLSKAQFLAQRAASVPGYNPVVVEKRLLESMDITDVDEVFPITPEGEYGIPPSPNPELEIERADMQRRVLEGKVRGEVDTYKAETDRLLKEAQAVKAMAEAGAIEQEVANERLQILDEHQKRAHEEYMQSIDLLMKQMDVLMQEFKVDEASTKAQAAQEKLQEQKQKANENSEIQSDS